jgi:glycosyltransferase involved in cell wall biosynthesis
MKVLYVSHTSRVSGAEHALLTLLRRLPERVSPAVACPDGPLADAVRELGVPVLPFSGTEASLRLHPVYTPQAAAHMAMSALAIRRLTRRLGADLVHANSIRAGVMAALAERAGGAPAAVHLHDHLPPGMLSSATLGVIGRFPRGILACSGFVLEQLPSSHRQIVTRVIYNPVDTARFDPDRLDRGALRAQLGLRPGDSALVLVAQITPWKGQDDAVRMLWRLKRSHPRVRLLLVGSPKFVSRQTRHDNVAFSRSLEELIGDLGVQEEVWLLGERQDIPELLRAADVFLVPSWEEPFSLSAIEAMAMRLPVLATVVGGLREIIDGRNGVLLPPQQPDRWAAEIEQLLKRPDLRRTMGERARRTITSQLEASRWVDDVVAAYDAVLAGVGASTPSPARTRPAPAGAPPRHHVLYVNHTGQVSGAERSLLTLLGGLDRSVSATVACPKGRLSDELRALGIESVPIHGTDGSLKLHPLRTPFALASLARDALEIRHAADELGADVIHANSIRAGISAGIVARLGGPPAVVHIRDRLPPGATSRLTFRVLAGTASAVVANSRYTAEGFTAAAALPVRVLHNPVDLSRFDPQRVAPGEARRKLGLEPTDHVLGVVAQITPWKAQDDAIRIAAELRGSRPEVKLLLVGSALFVSKATRFDNARYFRELKRLTQILQAKDSVMFLGERDDVPELLSALDVLLVPSWQEPFGRAIIEAMAMRVPVVATSVGGPAEILAHGREGYLLPPREPSTWANVVGDLLDRADVRREMGVKGRERVTASFNPGQHVRELLALYDEVVERPS